MDTFFRLSLIFIPKEIHSVERYSIFVATEIVDMKTIYIKHLFFFFLAGCCNLLLCDKITPGGAVIMTVITALALSITLRGFCWQSTDWSLNCH